MKQLLIAFFSRVAMMYYSSAIISKIFMPQLQFVSTRRECIYHVYLFYLNYDVFGDLSPSREIILNVEMLLKIYLLREPKSPFQIFLICIIIFLFIILIICLLYSSTDLFATAVLELDPTTLPASYL